MSNKDLGGGYEVESSLPDGYEVESDHSGPAPEMAQSHGMTDYLDLKGNVESNLEGLGHMFRKAAGYPTAGFDRVGAAAGNAAAAAYLRSKNPVVNYIGKKLGLEKVPDKYIQSEEYDPGEAFVSGLEKFKTDQDAMSDKHPGYNAAGHVLGIVGTAGIEGAMEKAAATAAEASMTPVQQMARAYAARKAAEKAASSPVASKVASWTGHKMAQGAAYGLPNAVSTNLAEGLRGNTEKFLEDTAKDTGVASVANVGVGAVGATLSPVARYIGGKLATAARGLRGQTVAKAAENMAPHVSGAEEAEGEAVRDALREAGVNVDRPAYDETAPLTIDNSPDQDGMLTTAQKLARRAGKKSSAVNAANAIHGNDVPVSNSAAEAAEALVGGGEGKVAGLKNRQMAEHRVMAANPLEEDTNLVNDLDTQRSIGGKLPDAPAQVKNLGEPVPFVSFGDSRSEALGPQRMARAAESTAADSPMAASRAEARESMPAPEPRLPIRLPGDSPGDYADPYSPEAQAAIRQYAAYAATKINGAGTGIKVSDYLPQSSPFTSAADSMSKTLPTSVIAAFMGHPGVAASQTAASAAAGGFSGFSPQSKADAFATAYKWLSSDNPRLRLFGKILVRRAGGDKDSRQP